MTSFEYTIKVSSSFTLESRRSVLHNVTQYFAPIVRYNLTQAFIMNQQTLCGFSQHALERFIFYKSVSLVFKLISLYYCIIGKKGSKPSSFPSNKIIYVYTIVYSLSHHCAAFHLGHTLCNPGYVI